MTQRQNNVGTFLIGNALDLIPSITKYAKNSFRYTMELPKFADSLWDLFTLLYLKYHTFCAGLTTNLHFCTRNHQDDHVQAYQFPEMLAN